jgi:hypothetical protein
VFRTSTYVFSSPESAERAFDLATGRAQRAEGENVELIYSRINHPNAEILEDQIVPLEPGAGALNRPRDADRTRGSGPRSGGEAGGHPCRPFDGGA